MSYMPLALRYNLMGLLVSEPVLVFGGTVTNSKIHNRCVDRSAILPEVDSTLRMSTPDQVKLYKFSNIRNRQVKRNTRQTLKQITLQYSTARHIHYRVCMFHTDLVCSVIYLDATTQSC